MAGLLARFVGAGRALLPLPPLDRHAVRRPDIWGRPHNALFDLDATREGAEEIDAVGARAEPLLRGGPIVLGHHDWSVKQFRFRGDEVTAARCEHALAARGFTTFVTRAREALPEFAAELLP